MDTKQDLYICCLKYTPFRSKDTHRLKVRGWKKVLHTKEKKVGGCNTFIRQNRLKDCVPRDKEGQYTMIKGSIQE